MKDNIDSTNSDIPVVVYLSRFQDKESEKLFSSFAKSYLTHPAGRDHDLLLLKKGYENHTKEWESRTKVLSDIPFLEREVQDDTYTQCDFILREFSDRYILFLTATSEILVDNWLNCFMRHAHENRILGAYGGGMTCQVMWDCKQMRGQETFFLRHPRQWFQTTLMRFSVRFFLCSKNSIALNNPFSPFPQIGLRTNGLLLPPRILQKIDFPANNELGVKMCMYIFESGKDGLFGQAVSKGMELYVVGSDGRATPATEGYLAETYFCGNQKNLIIGDKSTRFYDALSKKDKQKYDCANWGQHQPFPRAKLSLSKSANHLLIPCPVCGHKRTFPYLTAQDYNRHITEEWFHYNKCEACFSLFITNPPENLGDYYADDYGPYNPGINRPYVDWWLSLIKQYVPNGGTYYELGPGAGDFIRAVKNAGYSVRGIEMNQNACEFLQKEGIEMVQSDDLVASLESIEDNLDCIAASQVLEHLRNPIQVLKSAAAKLKPGGIMIVSMPNLNSFEADIFRQYWWGVDAPRHQTLMTYETFVEIAKNMGFEVVKVSSNDVVAEAINKNSWYFSFNTWQTDTDARNHSYWRYKLAKHVLKNGIKLLRLINSLGKHQHLFGNSYTIVLQKIE